MNLSLNFLYRTIGTSKQNFHQHLNRQMRQHELQEQIVYLVSKIRKDHPGMALRDIYYKIQPEEIGRDKFEAICQVKGFGVKQPKNYKKTTDSSGVLRFDNLIEGIEINRINQVWQSDITYYELNGRFYYITLIQDAFSKVIVGYNTSKRLSTEETTLPALKRALRHRRTKNIEGLIFHSDGGGQYYDKNFLQLTEHQKIINSMSEYAWENGMAERLNGVIKNNYLKHKRISSFKELKHEVDRTVQLYNSDKPHSSLKRLTPFEFEEKWINLHCRTEAKMTESFDAKHQMNGTSSPFHLSRTETQNQDVISAITLDS